MFDINMYDLSDLPNKVTYYSWRTVMVFNGEKIINSLTTIILSILFLLARWTTIEMPSNSPPTFPFATGGYATANRTPCSVLDIVVISGDDVCCSVVFGTLVGVFVFSVCGPIC